MGPAVAEILARQSFRPGGNGVGGQGLRGNPDLAQPHGAVVEAEGDAIMPEMVRPNAVTRARPKSNRADGNARPLAR